MHLIYAISGHFNLFSLIFSSYKYQTWQLRPRNCQGNFARVELYSTASSLQQSSEMASSMSHHYLKHSQQELGTGSSLLRHPISGTPSLWRSTRPHPFGRPEIIFLGEPLMLNHCNYLCFYSVMFSWVSCCIVLIVL